MTSPGEVVSVFTSPYLSAGAPALGEAKGLMKELEEELNNCEEKEEALDILLNSQMREINENNVMNNMQKVEYPDWIQSEVLNMTEDTIIPINFNKK